MSTRYRGGVEGDFLVLGQAFLDEGPDRPLVSQPPRRGVESVRAHGQPDGVVCVLLAEWQAQHENSIGSGSSGSE